MKFLIRIISIVIITVFFSSFKSDISNIKDNYYLEYTIETMHGEKTFRMESADGFNANIIDGENGEMIIEVVDDQNDLNKISIKCAGNLTEGKHKVDEANYYSDNYNKKYSHHSDTYLTIESIDENSISGKIEGYCYDLKVSHNYKMKLTGTFRIMILK